MKGPPEFHWNKWRMSITIVASCLLLVQRTIFVLLGWFDTETEPAVIQGLKHPYGQVWQAPYGVLWYGVNLPLTWIRLMGLSEAQSWLLLTSCIDSIFILYLALKADWSILGSYIPLSILTWRQAPYNLTIFWLTGLGVSHSVFLGLAIIAKLPLGAPLEVWNFALRGPSVLTNWRYYGMLIFFWLLVAYGILRRKNTK